ncbi:uncharacterized protein PHALS_13443 [Plasmopara halstedii]|uniref:Uncharacterized protein n=1 Tax=Plasmopara halstedii TaxID=4781 RepID=A0A0P1AQ54_PLAHL|nr:uncharacterized protein PHALS_13443 [Plasmopara halstedii]CEG43231.1 hypothetical protein PHALS_13443 [Plasmopara halstedii]|eukprot:XP_024579600.1 hypothetical protein PHALS_13443 [Plasmopara halstedii]
MVFVSRVFESEDDHFLQTVSLSRGEYWNPHLHQEILRYEAKKGPASSGGKSPPPSISTMADPKFKAPVPYHTTTLSGRKISNQAVNGIRDQAADL